MTERPPAVEGAGAAAAPPRIAVLPPEVAARIAAGEVIERPASVVKELVENALDAGARRVEVELEGGGVERIRVRDDGGGIPPEQLADAFERHATSKLRSERELFAVRTLGFRGEALAAIAAAADVELTSRPPGQGAAVVARYRGGRAAGLGAAAAAEGTTVEVRELFAALPARRRFLRSARAEARAVVAVVGDAALARPDVAFRLVADGRVLLTTAGGGALDDAVAAVHGAEAARALLPLGGEREAEGARAVVGGAAAAPSLHRASRRYLHVTVNGRPIAARALTHAVEQAYAGLIPAGRHPLAVVRIELSPEQVDVNVHPTKAEVRFRHQRLVHAAVAGAVREAVAGAAPPAGPAPVALAPPFAASGPPSGRAAVAAAVAARPSLLPGGDAPSGVGGDGHDAGEGAGDATATAGGRLPALRVVGQVALTYLVAEAPDGLYLVDQHAGHERVLYERALAAAEPRSRPLLAAVVASLSAQQAALAAEHAQALAALGWELEPADGAALLVRALPEALAESDPARALADYLDRLQAEERLPAPDRAAAALACHAAVRAGDRMEASQQRALLEALERTQQPQTCPHGRPVVLRLDLDTLARSFGRR